MSSILQHVLLLCLLASSSRALTSLSDWRDGIATYYGGPADNMNPYSPSYGTQDVRTWQISRLVRLPQTSQIIWTLQTLYA
jgi:hypothetical protein